MQQVTVEMESRECPNCRRTFRVMASSKQKMCSKMCEEYGTAARGERPKPSQPSANKTASVTVDVSKPIQNLKSESVRDGFLGVWPKRKNLKDGSENTTSETRSDSMPSVQSVQETTKNTPLLSSVTGISETESSTQPKSVSAEIVETQPGSLEESQRRLANGALDSMTLLRKSENKLLDLMEECVSSSDLDRSKTGGAKVEGYRIEQAIQCANALTQTVKTKAELLKAAAELFGK